MRLSPLTQRTGLSQADYEKATRLSREMALFTRLQGGATPRPGLSPGTHAFTRAAKRDYAELLVLHGRPRLPVSFVVQKLATLPEPVAASFHAFTAQHAGQAEIAVSAIDGHRTWQAQVVGSSSAQVLLLDVKGRELASGVARADKVCWR